jgi:ubiquinone/menaquinone biosynthesis C-methylase UbiE
MLYDFQRLIPGITLRGIDISEYAIQASVPEVKPFLDVGDATELPYPNDSFDLVIAINTLHNLEGQDLINAFSEVMRVTRDYAFVTVDAYRNESEKEAMLSWNLTAKTIKSVEEWKAFFRVIGYTGDFFWFTP